MKTISGESFEIRLGENNNTVFFKGALRLSGMEDYAPILEMLQGTLINQPSPIVLDLRELDFLNSSGITMLSRFVIEARDQAGVTLYFFASETIAWHARSLKNLQRLMPALRIRLSCDKRARSPGGYIPLKQTGIRGDGIEPIENLGPAPSR